MREMRVEDILQGKAFHEEDPVFGLSMFSAELRIEGDAAGAALPSIGPEAGRELPRTETEIAADGEAAVIRIKAADASSMRAALNSYLECIRIVEDIHRLTEVRQ